MITPSFNLTATERVLPKLALDFTTASLDSRVTFTRTGATATRVNSSGYIETVAADIARFDFDPVTLACKGLLIEEARTNLFTNSENFSDWGVVGGETSVTTASGTSPANTNTANLLEKTGANTFRSVSKSTTVVSGTSYVWTIFLKAGTAAATRLRILNAADISLTVDWSNPGANGVNFDDGWYRYQIAFTAATTTAQVLVYPSGSGSAAGNILAWGAQLEAGAFATSYIPTEASQVTRTADVATMTGTNFSDWFNATEGTFVAKAITAQADAGYAITCTDGTSANQLALVNGTGTGAFQVVTSTSLVVNMATRQKTASIVGGYKVNNFAASVNAGTVATDTSGALPTLTRLDFGKRGDTAAFTLNGTISKVMYWPQRLTNAEVQTFSKG